MEPRRGPWLFIATLAVLAAPALAHGVYSAQAGDYEVILHLARPNETAMPMDVMAGEAVDIAFLISNRATGEEVAGPGPAVEVVHTMGSMRHAMRVEARPPEPPYFRYIAPFTFTDGGMVPVTVVFPAGGKEVRVPVEVHVLPAAGARPAHMMPGIPNWLFLASAGGAVALTFVAVEFFAKSVPGPAYQTRDLLRIPVVRRLARWRPLPALLQAGALAFLFLVVAAGLLGTTEGSRNFATVGTWTGWWVLLVVLILFLGKAFCYFCPIRGFGDGLRRLLLGRLPEERGTRFLQRPWPRKLRTPLVAIALLLVLFWFDLGYSISKDPPMTAFVVLALLALAASTTLLIRRNFFCRYMCPVGLMSGVYASLAPLELRARDVRLCASCLSKECLKGNAGQDPCPLYLHVGSLKDNRDCILCLKCARNCPRDNVALNLRPFGADLFHATSFPAVAVGAAAVVLLAMASFHGFTMVPHWQALLSTTTPLIGRTPSFTLWMAVFLAALTGVVAAFVLLAHRTSGRGARLATLFGGYALSLIPIALFYHMAHNLGHLSAETGRLFAVASDPFGWGWNLLGTAGTSWALLPLDATWYLQAALIVAGHIVAVTVAWVFSRRMLDEKGAAFRAHLPVTALMVFYTVFSLWLAAQPMVLATGL